MFYRGNITWVRVRVRMNEITSALAPEWVPIFYFRDKTWVQMVYFDSNTTVPLQCAALVFLESVCWQDVVWLTVLWDPIKISFETLIKLIAQQRLDQRFQIFQWQFCDAYLLLVFVASQNTYKYLNLLIHIIWSCKF